ncbi:hypothetical protein M0811_14823 [Anaeramoeba ignava]|uniref:Uncharacterized protein n=1 Tax=Anaeramoeba ignava TaxID=1746090 RepID=A0A9Q0RG00_ANAIG|nr:hypothetical protein M0811_14823 [Anaeramoeba ignava]
MEKDQKKLKNYKKLFIEFREIPDSFFDHIFDFGSLDDESEKLYLNEMIKQKFRNNWGFIQDEINESIELYKHLLSKSHQFAKLKSFDTKSSISLRDAARTLKIWEYLLNDDLTLNLFIDPEEFRAMEAI